MAIRKTDIKRYESQAWVDIYPVTAWAYIENIPSTFPPSAHTHNYAGSSSAGGDANNAVKLNGQTASYYLNYNNFTNTPTIPTKTSQLTNDSGYLTSSTLTGDVVIDALGYTPGTSNFTGYTSSNKLSTSYISGLATVATSGSYNDLSNKPTIPTKASWNYDDRYVRYDTASQGLNATQKANARTNIGAGTSNFTGYTDSNRLGTGYISGITEYDTLTEEISAMYSIMATKYVKPSGGIPASDLAQSYYLASNPNGYTSNTGTVTSVAVKMNGSVKGTITTSGTIDLGTVITSHQDISGKADKASMSAGWYRRVYVNTQGIVTEGDQGDTDTNTWRKVQLNGVDKLGNATSTNPLNIKNGSGISITESSGAFTFALNLTGDLVADALGYTPGTSNFSGSYNDLTNKPTIPTKVSQLSNDSGYITGITSSMVTTALGYTPYNSSNPNGYTSNTGTVTSVTVKMNGSNVGTITTSGTIDLGTVLTSKPSYIFTEIGAGHVIIGDGANYVLYRTHETWRSGYYYHTTGNEAVVFANKNASTSWIFVNAVDPTDRKDWTNLGKVPAMQIKTNSVAINKLIGNGVTPSYNLDVNGTANATTLYENGTSLASKYLGISATAADSSKLNGQAASYYLNYNNLSNKPTIPNVPSWALQSTKPSYDASEISCDAFGDDVSSILQAMDSAIGGKAASNHTHDTRYVRFDTASQGLNSTQKSNARTNIGAGTGNGTVTSVSVKINGSVKGTVTTSGTIDLGTIGGGGVEIGFVGYLYFNDDRNTPVWFEISAAGYGLSEGLYIIAPEDSYPGFKTDNARYWQGAISRLSATEGSFKLWKTRGDSCGYVQFTYSSQTSVTITSSDCAADYGKFIIYKVMNVNEP